MKTGLKKIAVIAMAGALAAGTAFSASAASIANGQWSQGTGEHANDWWFKLNEEGTSFLANTWYWIKDTDGVIRCYYFDQNGWMATDSVLDDGAVDANGHYVVNGQVVTADESKDYATAIDFAALKVVQAAAATPTYAVANAAGAVGNPDAATNVSAAVIKAKSGAKAGGGFKNPIKASGLGDSPVNAAFTQDYENSAISGATVINNWANYSMNTVKVATTENTGSGTDWYVYNGEAELICTYMPINKYTAGNTSLDSFVASYIADARGFKGGVNSGAVNLGAFSFVKLTKTLPTPYGNMNDYCYLRQIDGTNYVQILTVERNGDNYDFSDVLATMGRI